MRHKTKPCLTNEYIMAIYTAVENWKFSCISYWMTQAHAGKLCAGRFWSRADLKLTWRRCFDISASHISHCGSVEGLHRYFWCVTHADDYLLGMRVSTHSFYAWWLSQCFIRSQRSVDCVVLVAIDLRLHIVSEFGVWMKFRWHLDELRGIFIFAQWEMPLLSSTCHVNFAHTFALRQTIPNPHEPA